MLNRSAMLEIIFYKQLRSRKVLKSAYDFE